jgi:hypothetical protein
VRDALFALIATPAVTLSVAWCRHRRAFAHLGTGGVLLLVSCSYAWLLSVLLFASVVAPNYSEFRFFTIILNIVAMLFAVLVAPISSNRPKWQLVSTSAVLLLLWCYVLVVSAVV